MRVSLMLRGMFCLERTSPGFMGSVGEKAWFERKKHCINTLYVTCTQIEHTCRC